MGASHFGSFIFTFSYPLLQGSPGHHRWLHDQFPPFSPVLHSALGRGEHQASSFLDVVFLPLPLSALSSYLFLCLPCLPAPFTLPCKVVLARSGEQEIRPYSISLQFVSLYNGLEVSSPCGVIACWILAQTSSLVTRSLYKVHSILQ